MSGFVNFHLGTKQLYRWRLGIRGRNVRRGDPLPGEINELFVDEARRLIYACNFTGGRVEVISMDTHQSISRITTTPTPPVLQV